MTCKKKKKKHNHIKSNVTYQINGLNVININIRLNKIYYVHFILLCQKILEYYKIHAPLASDTV